MLKYKKEIHKYNLTIFNKDSTNVIIEFEVDNDYEYSDTNAEITTTEKIDGNFGSLVEIYLSSDDFLSSFNRKTDSIILTKEDVKHIESLDDQ